MGGAQRFAARHNIVEQVFVVDGRKRRARCRDGRHVSHECVAMLEKTAAFANRIGNLAFA